MPAIRGNVQTLLAAATQTTSGTAAVQNMSALLGAEPDAVQFILKTATVSGTSPTLDVYLQWSPDNGSTFLDFLHFTQQTTTGTLAGLWARRVSDGTAGTDVITTGDAALAAGKVINAPISTAKMQIKWVVGGTSPSFSFQVLACMDRD